MTKLFSSIVCITLLFTLSSFKNYDKSLPHIIAFNSLTILLDGTWENKVDNGTFLEIWTFENGKLLGKGVRDQFGKFTQFEKLELLVIDSILTYRTDVVHNKGIVDFYLVEFNDNIYIFHNLKHDFPQIIEYKFISSTMINVELKDTLGKTMYFTFTKRN